jgi:hypothetical protein
MNIFKQIIRLSGISLIILFIVVTAVSLMFPSTVVVSRAVNINASQKKIFNEINNFTSWKDWMDGVNDSTLKVHSTNESFIGETKITLNISDSNSVHSVWQNEHHKIMASDINLITNASNPDLTVVQWQFVQKLKWYPWEKFGSLFNDKILGTMMEKNLNKLKEICEK